MACTAIAPAGAAAAGGGARVENDAGHVHEPVTPTGAGTVQAAAGTQALEVRAGGDSGVIAGGASGGMLGPVIDALTGVVQALTKLVTYVIQLVGGGTVSSGGVTPPMPTDVGAGGGAGAVLGKQKSSNVTSGGPGGGAGTGTTSAQPSNAPAVPVTGGSVQSPVSKPQMDFIQAQGSDERTGPIDTIVLHGTAASRKQTAQSIVDYWNGGSGGEGQLSTHYIVGDGGKITQTLQDERAGRHTGTSLNGTSIGIEVTNDFSGPITDEQYRSLQDLVRYLMAKHGLTKDDITTHLEANNGHAGDLFGTNGTLDVPAFIASL